MNINQNITFTVASYPALITKQSFFTKQNNNYAEISYDNQGNFWREFQREKLYKKYLASHSGFRNIKPITQKEINERNNFHSSTLKDMFYQFNNFYKNLPIYLTHFQIRKNFLKIDQDIFYTKHFGIESFDLVNYKQQTLVGYDEIEANMALCFDLMKDSRGDYLLCIGKTNSVCELLKITHEDYTQVKEIKGANVSPYFTSVFSLNEVVIDSFINYVKFIPDNRLISLSNDQCLLIYDLIKENKVIFKVENDTPINHCDLNEDLGLIVCVGDSCSVDIIDVKSKGVTSRIYEHYDYGIVVKFNPFNNYIFATGNQDYSCRIWDLRKLDKSIYQLHGFTDSIGDLSWINKNRILYGENSLFLHVYDFDSQTLQTLNYFGSLNGIMYDSQFDKIYSGVYQEEESGIIEYDKLGHSYANIQSLNI